MQMVWVLGPFMFFEDPWQEQVQNSLGISIKLGVLTNFLHICRTGNGGGAGDPSSERE